MSPKLQPGLSFEWSYTVPARATAPQLYHDTPFCLDMPEVLATGYERGMIDPARFDARLAQKVAKAAA